VVNVLVALLGVHALVKFAFFFIVPDGKRRAALDRAYGDKSSATRVSDVVLMSFTIGISVLILWRGSKPPVFLAIFG
jgi:hypothetical protein